MHLSVDALASTEFALAHNGTILDAALFFFSHVSTSRSFRLCSSRFNLLR